MLSILGCLDRPTSGSVRVREQELTLLSRRERRSMRRDVIASMLPQPTDNLFVGRTGVDNLRIAAKQRQGSVRRRGADHRRRRDRRVRRAPGRADERRRAATAGVGVRARRRHAARARRRADRRARRRQRRTGCGGDAARDSRGATIVAATARCQRDRRRDSRWSASTTDGGWRERRRAAAGVTVVGRRGRSPPDRPRRRSGEMVVVRGRSGSGKSTLLALVAGVCAPGTGQVLVLGQAPRLDMAWSDLALVPQVLALSAELSIEENIADCGPASVRMRCD